MEQVPVAVQDNFSRQERSAFDHSHPAVSVPLETLEEMLLLLLALLFHVQQGPASRELAETKPRCRGRCFEGVERCWGSMKPEIISIA